VQLLYGMHCQTLLLQLPQYYFIKETVISRWYY